MTDLGRNDPCHCGSGKKYKQCCLKKDQKAERLERKKQGAALPADIFPAQTGLAEPLPATAKPEPPPIDPHMEALNALWDEFKAADYEAQIALFYDTLANKPDLMDGEMAFEFLNTIYSQAVERNERERFEALAESLREQLPDVYAAEAGYILDYRITNALTDGRYGDISTMAEEMAAKAEAHIDEFFNLLDQLAYHDQLASLIRTSRLAWPQVKDSTKVFGSEELAHQAVDYIVFDYVTRTSAPDGHDPALQEQIAPYMSLNLDMFSTYIATLSGQKTNEWTLDDFQFEPVRQDRWDDWDDDEEEDEEMPDEGRRNLSHLTWEFLSYLYRQEQVPYAKGQLARTELYQYILKRYDGNLEPDDESIFGIFSNPKRKKRRKPKSKPRRQQHLLCPDRGTLDRFLAQLLGIINPQYYKATALLELVPAWLRFLEARHLISGEQREQTLVELRGMDTELSKVVQTNPDPALLHAMTNWRSNAEQ